MITDIRQIDQAIKEQLLGLTVKDANNRDILVPVVYLNPEKEFKTETYPCIVFFRLGIFPDNTRWLNTNFYDNATFNPNTDELISVDEREAPLPFAVTYGIRLYYKYISDGTNLNTYILTKMGRRAYLTIGGSKYDIEFVSYKNPSATYREFGTIKANDPREFVDQYLYTIPIELDSASRKTVDVNRHGVDITAHKNKK